MTIPGQQQAEVTWEEALELLDSLGGAPIALALLAVGLGLAQLRIHLLQLLRQVVPLRPAERKGESENNS